MRVGKSNRRNWSSSDFPSEKAKDGKEYYCGDCEKSNDIQACRSCGRGCWRWCEECDRYWNQNHDCFNKKITKNNQPDEGGDCSVNEKKEEHVSVKSEPDGGYVIEQNNEEEKRKELDGPKKKRRTQRWKIDDFPNENGGLFYCLDCSKSNTIRDCVCGRVCWRWCDNCDGYRSRSHYFKCSKRGETAGKERKAKKKKDEVKEKDYDDDEFDESEEEETEVIDLNEPSHVAFNTQFQEPAETSILDKYKEKMDKYERKVKEKKDTIILDQKTMIEKQNEIRQNERIINEKQNEIHQKRMENLILKNTFQEHEKSVKKEYQKVEKLEGKMRVLEKKISGWKRKRENEDTNDNLDGDLQTHQKKRKLD